MSEARRPTREMTFYWRANPLPGKPLWFWLVLALLAFGCYLLAARLAGAPFFWVGALFGSVFVFLVAPAVTLAAADELDDLQETFAPVLRGEDRAFDAWFRKEARVAFDFLHPAQLATWALLGAAAVGTFLSLDPPYAGAPGVLFQATLSVGILVGIPTWYIVAALFRLQHRLARRPLKVKALDFGHRAMYDLTRDAYFLALLICGSYLWLIAAARWGILTMSPLAILWLSVLAFYPLGTLVWGLFQVHVLQQRIKLHHLERVSADVQRLYAEYEKSPTKENGERLATMVGIQDMVGRSNEWPLSVQTVLTFLLTGATALIPVLAPRWLGG